MKKILALLMAATLLFTASACTSDTKDDDDSKGKKSESSTRTELEGYWVGEIEVDSLFDELYTDYINITMDDDYKFDYEIDTDEAELYLNFDNEKIEYLFSGDQLCGVLKDVYTQMVVGMAENKEFAREMDLDRNALDDAIAEIDEITPSDMDDNTSDILVNAAGELAYDGIFVYDTNTVGACYKQHDNSIEAELTEYIELEFSLKGSSLEITSCTVDLDDMMSSDESLEDLDDEEKAYIERLYDAICDMFEDVEFEKVYLKDLKAKYDTIMQSEYEDDYYNCIDCGAVIPYEDWRCEECAADAECDYCGSSLETYNYDICDDCSMGGDYDYSECIDCGTTIPYWDWRCEDCAEDAECIYCSGKLDTDNYNTCDYCYYSQYDYDSTYSYGGKYDDYYGYDDYDYYY